MATRRFKLAGKVIERLPTNCSEPAARLTVPEVQFGAVCIGHSATDCIAAVWGKLSRSVDQPPARGPG